MTTEFKLYGRNHVYINLITIIYSQMHADKPMNLMFLRMVLQKLMERNSHVTNVPKTPIRKSYDQAHTKKSDICGAVFHMRQVLYNAGGATTISCENEKSFQIRYV